jgi:phage shock protein C
MGSLFNEGCFSRDHFEGMFGGGLYRSRNGAIMGVCRGIAERFDLSVFWVRLFTILLFIFTGFWPTGIIYFALAFLLKPEPVVPISSMDEQEFYDSYLRSKEMATDRIKRRYSSLEKRLQRLEHAVTTPEFDWESRLNSNQ